MARFDERSGNLYVTELGRVASHYYIRHASIVAYNELLKPRMSEAEVCAPAGRCMLHGICIYSAVRLGRLHALAIKCTYICLYMYV